MRAIHYEQFQGPLVIRELPEPQPADDGVVIEVRACGLCRSDWHGWAGHDTDVQLPHVPGHEFAGVVVETGSAVTKFRAGDRVTVPFCVGCGTCVPCLEGQTQVCDHYFQPGFTAWGAFAERVAIPRADLNLVKLPDEMGFAEAASLGCRFVTSYRALVHQAQLKAGQWLAVHGCGGVGLAAIMIGKTLGARIVAIDLNPQALAMARELGAEATLQTDRGTDASRELVRSLREITGSGPHVSIDAVGGMTTCLRSIHGLRKQGCHVQIGLMGVHDHSPPVPMHRVIARELKIVGSHGMAARDYPPLLELIAAGKLRPELLIGERVSMEAITTLLPEMELNRRVGMTVMVL
jgi:alcohol dehydrogenase